MKGAIETMRLTADDAIPTQSTVAKLGLAVTALAPWLWNWYVAPYHGPEMTAEVAAAVSVVLTILLTRIIDRSGG